MQAIQEGFQITGESGGNKKKQTVQILIEIQTYPQVHH